MKITIVHNTYQHHGGAEQVLQAERNLLLSRGHEVLLYERDSAEIDRFSFLERLSLPLNTIWSRRGYRGLQELIRRERPDVAHFHNVTPLISPSAYHACRDAGVPVVQTLHNFHLICPGLHLFCDNQICEACLGRKLALPGIRHSCYHGSRAQTMVMAAMLTIHHMLKTWDESIDRYIALTEFGRSKFVEGGLDSDKIIVKPNFLLEDPGLRRGHGRYALFVGRLVRPKGVQTLLQAWRQLGDIPLKIVGDGPLLDSVVTAARTHTAGGIEVLGRVEHAAVMQLMRDARFLVFPSEWYEGLPVTILEAFVCGTPVVASDLGAMAEVVEDGVTGLHFRPGNPDDLAAKVRWAWSRSDAMARMGEAARGEFEAKYTPDRNYEILMAIYEEAIDGAEVKSS
jgi:glycosyltransferase involved in cell wall biosynthesis